MKVSFELDIKTALRWVLGILLIWAALSKIANVQEFYVDLTAYRLPLGGFIMRAAAMILPWLELLCGLLLVSNIRTDAALVWSVLLSLIFAMATAQAWARGLHISCGCLNLRLIGLSENSAFTKSIETPAFAFFRALLLGTVAAYLLRDRLDPAPNERAEAARR